MPVTSDLNELSYAVIGAAIEVHKEIGGPGVLEKVYEEALAKELRLRGHRVERQLYLPVYYKGEQLETPLVLDLMVDDKIIIECKACEKTHPIHEAQLLTYLRITRKELGLLINFGEVYVKEGTRRVINDR